MTASRKKDFIPVRFCVEWHPTVDIESACVAEGMKPDDGTSFWDWVDPPDYRKTKVFQKFDEAVAFAFTIAEQDCFGGARIYRQEQLVVKDGKRSFLRWDDDCFWDGINGRPDVDGKIDRPDIDKPDQWCS